MSGFFLPHSPAKLWRAGITQILNRLKIICVNLCDLWLFLSSQSNRMKKIIFSALFITTGFIVNAQPPKVPAEPGTVFGEKTTADNAIAVEELFSQLAAKEGKKEATVKLKGVVTQVCQMEGCWIKIKSPNGPMMVKLKDHKFLVPVILEGKNVVISGTAEEKITSVEQLRHYAEDAGKSKEEIARIKEPKREVVMEARGILVL
jgi:hypothetical protein